MINKHTVIDTLSTRCPKLGGAVTFSYCKKVNSGLPCNRVLVCWELHFPVEKYMNIVLNKEEWDKVFNTPVKPRIDVLIELSEQAKELKNKQKK